MGCKEKLKRDKAAGPHGLPMDCYKEMREPQFQLVLDVLNQHWNFKPIPDELPLAQVIIPYKKGDKANLANDMPISLLNSNYKLLTALLQKRISDGLDPHLQRTQYCFRKIRARGKQFMI